MTPGGKHTNSSCTNKEVLLARRRIVVSGALRRHVKIALLFFFIRVCVKIYTSKYNLPGMGNERGKGILRNDALWLLPFLRASLVLGCSGRASGDRSTLHISATLGVARRGVRKCVLSFCRKSYNQCVVRDWRVESSSPNYTRLTSCGLQ